MRFEWRSYQWRQVCENPVKILDEEVDIFLVASTPIRRPDCRLSLKVLGTCLLTKRHRQQLAVVPQLARYYSPKTTHSSLLRLKETFLAHLLWLDTLQYGIFTQMVPSPKHLCLSPHQKMATILSVSLRSLARTLLSPQTLTTVLQSSIYRMAANRRLLV